jgi:hypothetical protein
MAQQTPIAVDTSELSSTPQEPSSQLQAPPAIAAQSGSTPIAVSAQELSSDSDPFAAFGGKVHKPLPFGPNSIGPQLSMAEQLKRDPGMPLRTKIREIENYTQEGRQVHPILATVGDYLRKVYVPGAEVPNDIEHPLASPVPPPLPGFSSALEDAVATSTAASAARAATTPAAEATPGIISKVVKGAKVAQPKAQSALREAASVASESPTAQPMSLPRILEQPIDTTESQAKSLYSKIDAAAGTDIKALREKLGNTEYQIRNLTDTEEDRALESRLELSRQGLLDKIDTAKQDAIKAGVDPATLDQADATYGKAQALREVEKIFKNPSNISGNARLGQEEIINVEPTVRALQKLQYADKYGGSRLEQALGEQNANALLGKLYEAQRLGQSAIKARRIAEWVGGGILAAGPVIEGTKTLFSK